MGVDTGFVVRCGSEKLARNRAITLWMVTRFISYRILLSVIFHTLIKSGDITSEAM
ncbi:MULTISPECIES: hypothetical protein [unclassified Pseudanabaena]|uniref:hypothetical protein n=1 Tax=unclassified Pseudanabaena TaxID=2593292 RepID=UPI000A4766FC|nr:MULTISPECIES: hypothetical protein [unclassified Pseudanabaena]